jgi:ubiquitin carboxyl-terminal hydrolase 7
MLTASAVEEMAMKHSTKGSDFRLWIEYTENPREAPYNKEHVNNNPYIVVFLKYFDPLNQSLRGLHHIYMRKNDKVQEIVPLINEMMKWPVKTELQLFEEIKPTMIEPIKGKQTFHQAEIQDGDIICFQKALTDKELEALKERKLCKDAKEFYDMLVNLTSIRFLPKQDGQEDFILTLSKKNTYDEVAEKVAAHVGVPPTHLRFFTVNANTGQIRGQIKRTPSMTLQLMVTSQYYATTQVAHNQLYYEVLEMSLAELETRKNVKFTWLTDGITREEPAESLVPKNGVMADLIPYIQKRFNVSDEQVPRIRFYSSHSGRYHKEYPLNFNVAALHDYMVVYGELVPQEESEMDLATARTIEAFHYHKEPSKVHSASVPFKFVVKKVSCRYMRSIFVKPY